MKVARVRVSRTPITNQEKSLKYWLKDKQVEYIFSSWVYETRTRGWERIKNGLTDSLIRLNVGRGC